MNRLGLVAAAALTCCAALPVSAPFAPSPYQLDDADPLAYVVRYDPPPVYELWWEEVRECAGVARPLIPYEALRFYAVGPDSDFHAGSMIVYALQDWKRPQNIVVAAPMIGRADILRHEFLHALTSPTRYQGHPDSIFRGPCDTLVYHADGRR